MNGSKPPLFAIIVPFERLERHGYIVDCINGCLAQTFQDFELILLPNKPIGDKALVELFGKGSLKKIRCVPTGEKLKQGRISVKRNMGIMKTKAKYIALVDSDAYPEPQWLESAVRILGDEKVGIVGGPTLAPEKIGFWEKTIIKTLPLYSVSTGLRYRMKKYKGLKIFDDVPSCNLITKRDLVIKAGLFDERYFTGEDTLFCRQIREFGKLILFNGKTAVHHHNRPLPGHLSRMRTFGACKVRLLKELGEFPAMNALLSLFFLYIFLTPFVFLAVPPLRALVLLPIMAYLFLICVDCLLNSVELFRLPFCVFIVFFTHIFYGFGSIEGFIFKKLSFRFN